MDIVKELFNLADKEYAEFQAKLTPSVLPDKFIGVRVPIVRKLAKDIVKQNNYSSFLDDLPHKYYDENMLHAVLISEIKDYEKAIDYVDEFLPFVDNWAVCDIMSPKCFKKNKDRLILKINEWVKSNKTYTCRFGIEMLMSHFLDGDFSPEYLKIPASVKSEEYYVNMMIAWFFATALTKQWDSTIPYIENGKLSKWVNNKTIQKAKESYRITTEQKEYLSRFKM